MDDDTTINDKVRIRSLIRRITSETVDDDSHVPQMVICLNIVFRPVIGTVCAIRGQYDGRLSIIGLTLSVVYFGAFMVVTYIDDRFKPMERWARVLPKLFGMAVAVIQLVGVYNSYACDTSMWRSCL